MVSKNQELRPGSSHQPNGKLRRDVEQVRDAALLNRTKLGRANPTMVVLEWVDAMKKQGIGPFWLKT